MATLNTEVQTKSDSIDTKHAKSDMKLEVIVIPVANVRR